jgi:hypothetical protein
MTARIVEQILIPLDGAAKKMSATTRFPVVRVVKEKSKKPEPREDMWGGETKMDTSSNTHQKKVIMRNKTVK